MSILDLETDRLKFRLVDESDFELFKTLFSNKDASRFIGGTCNPEEAWRILALYVGHYHLKGYSYFAVIEKETDFMIGCVGLWKSKAWPEHELGYWLLPEMQGKGYASEASLALKNYALNVLKFKSLVSYIHPENSASIKVAKKVGAVQDGLFDLFSYGQHYVYRYK